MHGTRPLPTTTVRPAVHRRSRGRGSDPDLTGPLWGPRRLTLQPTAAALLLCAGLAAAAAQGSPAADRAALEALTTRPADRIGRTARTARRRCRSASGSGSRPTAMAATWPVSRSSRCGRTASLGRSRPRWAVSLTATPGAPERRRFDVSDATRRSSNGHRPDAERRRRGTSPSDGRPGARRRAGTISRTDDQCRLRHAIHSDSPPATAVVRTATAPQPARGSRTTPPGLRLRASDGGGTAPFSTARPPDPPAGPPVNTRPGLNAP